MGLASVLTIDSVLKFTESKFKGVNVRAAHDDITTVGPPHIIAGTDGVPEALLGGLAEVGTGPQRTKFQAPGTTEEALPNKPGWLPAPSVVIDPANGESLRAFGMKIAGLQLANTSSKKTGFGRSPGRSPVL